MSKLKNLLKEQSNYITKSIRIKLFFMMTISIMVIILVLIFVNSFIVGSYYLHYKQYNLLQTYHKINQYVTSDLTDSEVKDELEKMALNNNFNILITTNNNQSLFDSNSLLREHMLTPGEAERSRVLYDKDNIYIIEAKDRKSNINFLMLMGKLSDNNIIYIRMPLSSIQDSVSISNNFLYAIGIITVIVSGIAILIISKKFTQPITELEGIANKMANLDFSQKYRIKDSGDEIDNLGKSINKMSDTLETTITKLQANNSELEKDIEEKSKLDEMRKQFISDVSHELKTPIALIQGYSEGLIENVNSDEENRKFYAEVILDEANKMDKMVKNLLELMKLEHGARKLENEIFNIVELIHEELRKYTVLFQENHIDVKFDVKKPVNAYADSNLIEQVLNNYISNAIKNAEEVNGQKYITISIEEQEEKMRIHVFNTGKTISQENLQKIWNRFYKEDSSRSREMGGTGIGLSLVKAIMNNYHNEYGVINQENGVEFYFDVDTN